MFVSHGKAKYKQWMLINRAIICAFLLKPEKPLFIILSPHKHDTYVCTYEMQNVWACWSLSVVPPVSCLNHVSREENKHSQLPANKRGLVRLGETGNRGPNRPSSRSLFTCGRQGTSVVSVCTTRLTNISHLLAQHGTSRPTNILRSTTSDARSPAPSPPSSIRIIADWKNKLRGGSRQFEETGRRLLNHRLSGPFDYHLLEDMSSSAEDVLLQQGCRCVVKAECGASAWARPRESQSLTANHSTPQECLGFLLVVARNYWQKHFFS